jgi:hypothetical protein
METLGVVEGEDSEGNDGNYEGVSMNRSSDIPKVNPLLTSLLWK